MPMRHHIAVPMTATVKDVLSSSDTITTVALLHRLNYHLGSVACILGEHVSHNTCFGIQDRLHYRSIHLRIRIIELDATDLVHAQTSRDSDLLIIETEQRITQHDTHGIHRARDFRQLTELPARGSNQPLRLSMRRHLNERRTLRLLNWLNCAIWQDQPTISQTQWHVTCRQSHCQ